MNAHKIIALMLMLCMIASSVNAAQMLVDMPSSHSEAQHEPIPCHSEQALPAEPIPTGSMSAGAMSTGAMDTVQQRETPDCCDDDCSYCFSISALLVNHMTLQAYPTVKSQHLDVLHHPIAIAKHIYHPPIIV